MDSLIRSRLENYRPEPYGQQRKYAVLLPLINRFGETHLLYEVRSQKISQPGESSFPGGHVEHEEEFLEAALRETEEELNIPASKIEIYGEIDYIVTEWAIIHCFVGRIHDTDFDEIQFNKNEVDHLFSLPLSFLMEQSPIHKVLMSKTQWDDDFPFELITNGRDYQFRHARHPIIMYQLEKERLWGITANLTCRFIQIINPDQQI